MARTTATTGTLFDPFDDRAKKLLRQARNRRHYLKKKRLQAIRGELAARHATVTGLHDFVPMGPLVPANETVSTHTTAINDLNRRILAWGYIDDHQGFVSYIRSELDKVRHCSRLLAKWIRAQDHWLLEGHSILGDMEKLIGGSVLMDLQPVEMRELWRGITETALRMQWMMAGVDLTLSTIDSDD